MPQLFYFTHGGAAHEHYEAMRHAQHRDFGDLILEQQKRELEKPYHGQPIKVWGAVPGSKNATHWYRLAENTLRQCVPYGTLMF